MPNLSLPNISKKIDACPVASYEKYLRLRALATCSRTASRGIGHRTPLTCISCHSTTFCSVVSGVRIIKLNRRVSRLSSSPFVPRSTPFQTAVGHPLPRQHALLPPNGLEPFGLPTTRRAPRTRGQFVSLRALDTPQCQPNQLGAVRPHCSSHCSTAVKLRHCCTFITKRWSARPEEARFPVTRLLVAGSSAPRNWTAGLGLS